MSDDKKWCKLVFKQFQPMHIGAGNYGVINETRIFIPGWTMWGALTKAYNLRYNKGNLSENQNLFEEISCFYPCFDEKGKTLLLPKFQNGEFYLGNYSEKKFRAKIVDTFVSTAILPGSRMAKDESLHEMDVILQGAKAEFIENEKEKQLYWVGILNIDEKKENEFLKEGTEIHVGGDSRYGLGKMELVETIEIGKNLPEEWKIRNKYLVNYYPAKDGKYEGKIEFLVQIVNSFESATLSVVPQKASLYYVPGSYVNGRKIYHNRLIKGIIDI